MNGSDENRREPVAWRGDRARRHDAGDGARRAGEEHDERAPLEPDPAHDAIDDESGPRHVADVLEEMDQREEDDDLRKEDEDRAHPGENTVRPEIGEKPPGEGRVRQPAELTERTVDGVHRRHRPREDALKHEEHDRDEDEPSHERVEQPPVDVVAAGVRHEARWRRRPRQTRSTQSNRLSGPSDFGNVRARDQSSGRSSARFKASRPTPRCPTTGKTGMPRTSCSAWRN